MSGKIAARSRWKEVSELGDKKDRFTFWERVGKGKVKNNENEKPLCGIRHKTIYIIVLEFTLALLDHDNFT